MGGVMTPYIVRQGDYLAKLAFVHGFDADEVWNDPKNEDVKKLRPDPNILAPGDIVYLPEKKEGEGLPIEKGTENSYAATVPKVSFSILLKNPDGSPIASRNYWIEGLGETMKGTTDVDGKLSFEVPVLVRELDFHVEGDRVIRRLMFGGVDPHQETSGVRQRLSALGYGPPGALSATTPPGEPDEDSLSASIRCFQSDHGLEPTGQVDDATSAALRDAFGC